MRVALQRFRLTVRVEMVHLAPLTRINLLWLNVSQAIGLLVNAAVGREPSEQATLRGHCAADRLAVHASRVGELPTERISVSREAGVGKVSEGRVEGAPRGSPEEQNWPFRGLWKHLTLQTRPTIAFSGGQVYSIGPAEGP
jgi:hypothetical protein